MVQSTYITRIGVFIERGYSGPRSDITSVSGGAVLEDAVSAAEEAENGHSVTQIVPWQLNSR